MKLKSKIILSSLSVVSVAAPIAATISCGFGGFGANRDVYYANADAKHLTGGTNYSIDFYRYVTPIWRQNDASIEISINGDVDFTKVIDEAWSQYNQVLKSHPDLAGVLNFEMNTDPKDMGEKFHNLVSYRSDYEYGDFQWDTLTHEIELFKINKTYSVSEKTMKSAGLTFTPRDIEKQFRTHIASLGAANPYGFWQEIHNWMK